MRNRVIGAHGVVLTLVLVGCGGGAETLSAADFRTQVSAICRRMDAGVLAASKGATPASRRRALLQARDALDRGIAQLEMVKPPEKLQARFDRVKAGMALRRQGVAHLAGPHPRLTAAENRALDAHPEVNPARRVALELGLRGC